MEIKRGLCQLVSQGSGSYRFLDWSAENGSLYMSNDGQKRGTYWLVRPTDDRFDNRWLFEKPSSEGELNSSISGSGVYLVTKLGNYQWNPAPQPYIAMGDDITEAPWVVETYNAAPGCFNFRSDGYLNGDPGDSTAWRNQVFLTSHSNGQASSWKLLYLP